VRAVRLPLHTPHSPPAGPPPPPPHLSSTGLALLSGVAERLTSWRVGVSERGREGDDDALRCSAAADADCGPRTNLQVEFVNE